MKRSSRRRTVSMCAIVLLAGCGGSQSQTVGGGAMPIAPLAQRHASTYKVLFNFSGKDGAAPLGDLLAVGNTLYGTTSGGGATGMGTLFSITTAGAESVVYNFKGGSDGSVPTAGPIEVGNTFYGTTYSGGKNGNGTVYSVSSSGTETVLYSFKGAADGAHPRGGLTDDGGTLYGTTEYGGAACTHQLGCGTVFSITTAGKESVVYAFKGGADGKDPRAGLAHLKGVLYGTTRYGGTDNQGTVFGLTTAGTKTILWNFLRQGGGFAPQYGTPLALNGLLLGVASAGDGHGCGGAGCGSIYAVDPREPGELQTLSDFRGGRDGGRPFGSMSYMVVQHQSSTENVLFGTTFEGGASDDGTIFTLSNNGETVLHSFSGGKDGGEPYGGPTPLNGTLYGTTNGAGSHGTVYALTP